MSNDTNRELRGETALLADEVLQTPELTLLGDPANMAGEAERLAGLESIIERGQQAYIEIGIALDEIRRDRLYRNQGFPTFEAYCRERWQWKSPQVPYNYMAAAGVALSLQLTGEKPKLSQAVVLATVPPEQQREAVKTLESRGKMLADATVSEVSSVVKNIKSRESKRDEAAASKPSVMRVSCTGDLWLLGRHSVLVGDTTKPGDVAKLIAANSADLLFLDPPYNVDYKGRTQERLTMPGDRMSEEEYKQFLAETFCACRLVAKSNASLYVCHPSCRQREYQNALEAAGFSVRNQLIWAKNAFAVGWGRYQQQHEPIFYCHVAGETDAWYGDRAESTLWEEAKPSANRLHPTMKPVLLIERALLNSTKAGDIVADLFGGSGSTLIACENHGRYARVMEKDLNYADVIVRRWQEYTGKPAILDGDGRTFDQITGVRDSIAA